MLYNAYELKYTKCKDLNISLQIYYELLINLIYLDYLNMLVNFIR